jgi:hypothetical protein
LINLRSIRPGRSTALVLVTALAACSGGGSGTHPIPGAGPASSSKTKASFVVHWPTALAATAKRRDAISPSTASITVAVDGGAPSVVNRPTISGSPPSTTISIVAPVGNDTFTFTAWDEPGGAGNVLDVATTSQNIVANANNSVGVTLDGVCTALLPSLSGTTPYAQPKIVTIPLASGATQSILQKLRLVGPSAATVVVNQVDADGNTVLNSAGAIPIELAESGTTPHVTIAPVSNVAGNNQFTLTPLVAEPDGASTSITATSPNCGSGTVTFPNSFALSTASEILVADKLAGIVAFDQDGTQLANIATTTGITGLAYNPATASLVAIETTTPAGGFNFQTLTTTGTSLGSGTVTIGTLLYPMGNIAYNPVSGNYLIDLREYVDKSGNTHYGSVKEYTISGSTATAVTPSGKNPFQQGSSSPPPYDPDCFAIYPNGDVIVGDDQTDSYLYDQNGNSLGGVSAYEANAFAIDSLRNYVLDFSSTGSGYVLSESALNDIGYFYYSGLVSSETVPAAVYNPGADELIGLGATGGAFGLAGSVYLNSSNAVSNLGASAFSSITAPTEAVLLP